MNKSNLSLIGVPGGSVSLASDLGSGLDLGFVNSSPVLGSVLTAQNLEHASGSVSSSHSVPFPLSLCLFLSKINIKKFKNKTKQNT